MVFLLRRLGCEYGSSGWVFILDGEFGHQNGMHWYGVWEHCVLAIDIGNDFYTGAAYHLLQNLVV